MFSALEVTWKVPVALPIAVLAVPVVLMLALPPAVVKAPVLPIPPLKVPRPVTARVPPRLVAPVPTVRVFDPVMETLPPKLLAPAVTVNPPAVMVAPPVVTVRPLPTVALLVTLSAPVVVVPPTEALLVTDKPVPAAVNELAAVKVFAWLRYATLDSVPAMLMSTPPSCKAAVALTEPPWTVAVVVMLLPVEIVPKPDAMLPATNAPVLVMLPCTAVGRVWVRPGTLLASVARMELAAAAVAWIALPPLP